MTMFDPKKKPFGFTAMIVQLSVVLIGMPVQIMQNYAAHSVGPLSLVFVGLPLLASAFWLAHGWREVQDPYLVLPQIPAIIFGLVLVGQILLYR